MTTKAEASEARSVFHFSGADWKAVLKRTKSEISDDNVPIMAAGVAFYFMLAMFPLMIALVTLYGLIADPATVGRQLDAMMGVMPPSAVSVLEERLQDIVRTAPSALGLGLVVSLIGALWSASSGVSALIKAVNIAYDEDETRGFLKVRGAAILATLALLVLGAIAILTVTALPSLLEWVGVNSGIVSTISWLRWPVLFAGVVVALMYVYRWSPDRSSPRIRWVVPGALAAATLWIAASLFLSLYASRLGSYEATYGALAGVIVLLLWLWATSFAFLLGAELNSEIEAQTRVDTTSSSRGGFVSGRGRDAHAGA